MIENDIFYFIVNWLIYENTSEKERTAWWNEQFF